MFFKLKALWLYSYKNNNYYSGNNDLILCPNNNDPY